MKYSVLAIRWDSEIKEQIIVVIGEFPSYTLAKMFSKVYEEQYSTKTKIMEGREV